MSKTGLSKVAGITAESAALEKLREITAFLENKIGHLPVGPGLSGGKAGIALYFYTYALWVDENERYIHLTEEALNQAIIDIYSNKNFGILQYTEISELGIVITYLMEEGFLDESYNRVLDVIDGICFKAAPAFYEQGNFDRFTGYLTIARYFLNRSFSAVCREGLQLAIGNLLGSARQDSNGRYWESKLFDQHQVYLGWSHGSAGIILFLSSVLEKKVDYREEEISTCLAEASSYLLASRVGRSESLYPDILGEEKKNSPLNLCYGDLGISYAILSAGIVLGNTKLYLEGMSGLLHSAARRSLSACNVHDASLIYGASGLMIFFSHLHTQYEDPAFYRASEYWYAIAQEKSNHEGKTAGYAGYYNQTTPHINETLYEGLTGFGLALIAHRTGTTDLLQLIGY